MNFKTSLTVERLFTVRLEKGLSVSAGVQMLDCPVEKEERETLHYCLSLSSRAHSEVSAVGVVEGEEGGSCRRSPGNHTAALDAARCVLGPALT